MTRSELQHLAATVLQNGRRLICQWATGVGKSGVVMEFLKANPEATALILVPEQNNIENWMYEFTKFGVAAEQVRVICYASLPKYQNTSWDLLVFDEAPHVDTELKKEVCRTICGEHVLALGAVISEEEKQTLEELYGHFRKSTISIQTAIQQNFLSPPEINVLHLFLDDKKKLFWYNGYLCTAKEYYEKINQKVRNAADRYEANKTRWNRQLMLREGSNRKRFLGKMKTDAMRMVCKKLEEENKRFLCFCSSIKQAEELGSGNAFTSQTPASMKMLDRFNNYQINSLYVVGKLIEGQNLRGIDCGVIGQLGGTERITVQEIGRIMRSDNPVIYVLVFDDTKDDSFLYTLTSTIPAEYIKHKNLYDIS